MPIRGDNLLNKLILLFVFDKMETPLSEQTIEDVCCNVNDWLAYMDCKPTLYQLIENSFIYKVNEGNNNNTLYAITPDGRMCLADFFVKIPTSTRENISLFSKQHRSDYRKMQEYVADYFQNKDNSYTVFLKIMEPTGVQFELKLNVQNKQVANNIYKKWKDKADLVYTSVYDTLVE